MRPLPEAFFPGAGGAGHQEVRHDGARPAGAGGGERRQEFPGPVASALRPGLRRRWYPPAPGPGGFSVASLAACHEMACRLEQPLHLADLEQMAGHNVREVAWANRC
ncbi:hypothetical protein DFAR_2920007 [Desulfarculales bacterium]